MRQNQSASLAFVGVGVLLTIIPLGCSSDDPSTESVLAREQPNQCGGSVPRQLANLAAASASELRRWEATRDFRLATSERLELSAEGQARCASGCPLTRAVLSLQEPGMAAPDHDPEEFAAALVAGFERQLATEQQQGALAEHELSQVGEEPSLCGRLFWYEAEAAGCVGDCRYDRPEELASKLVFAGYPDNPYLAFESATDWQGRAASLVAVDPTWDLDPPPSSGDRSCVVSCQTYVSSGSPGGCCTCNGNSGTWLSTATANVYKCSAH